MAKPYAGLINEIKAKTEEVSRLFAAADEKGAEMGEAERTRVMDLNKEIEELEVKAHGLAELEGIRDTTAQRAERMKARQSGTETPALASGGTRPEAKSLSDQVLGDGQFKSWHENMTANGAVSDRVRVDSPRVSLKTLIASGSTSAGAFISADRTNIFDGGTFQRPLRIRDLVTTGTTDSNSVEFVRQTGFTNNAAIVAEATSAADGAKPESALSYELDTETVRTLAHWIPITRQALADVGQMRMYIEQFLRYGLEEVLDTQMVTGSGVGNNFTGILNTTGIQTQAYTTDLLTTTRKARTKVVTVGRAQPTAYAFNPADWETIDLLQDNEARYYFGGPSVLGTPRLWGLPVVESEAVTSGHGIIGDWRLAALWDRQQAQIFVTDSHSDFFIRNILVLLAEMRAAFGVIRPAAFVDIDLTA